MNDITETLVVIVFLLSGLSLLTSILVDAAVNAMKLRGMLLMRAIRQMLEASQGSLFDKFCRHPLFRAQLPPSVSGLTRMIGSHSRLGWPRVPSEFDGDVFAAIVLDEGIAIAQATSAAGTPIPTLLTTWATTDAGAIGAVVREASYSPTFDYAMARTQVATLYVKQMERCKGWFRRRVWLLNLGVGFGLAVLLNVDLWSIRALLQQQEPARQSAVKAVASFYETKQVQQSQKLEPNQKPADNAAVGNPPTPVATPLTELEKKVSELIAKGASPAEIEAAQKAVDLAKSPPAPVRSAPPANGPSIPAAPPATPGAGPAAQQEILNWVLLWNEDLVPLGWQPGAPQTGSGGFLQTKEKFPGIPQLFFREPVKLGHLLLTALLLSLGAPFWYDLLNRLLALRQAKKAATVP